MTDARSALEPFATAACLYAAAVFARAAVLKARDRARFEGALAAYRLLPSAWVGPVSAAVPAAEVVVALALLAPAARAEATLAAAALWLTFALAALINLQRGRRDIDCGCGGAPRPISAGLVVQNAAAAALLLALGLPPSAGPTAAGWALATAAALTALMLHLAAETLGGPVLRPRGVAR